jgi:kynureninase
VFVHEKHGENPDLPRFAGWWGHREDVRFKMQKGFIPEKGAAGWQLSNAPVLSMAVHKASLEIFDRAGMDRLVAKSKLLSGYLEFVLKDVSVRNDSISLTVITPSERGCQLSVLAGSNARKLFDYLTQNGVVADWREPEVIRMAPVPLYNSFEDIYRLGEMILKLKIKN